MINILLVLIVATASFILTARYIHSLVTTYAVQSLLMAATALTLYQHEQSGTLLLIALMTLVTKVFVIPTFLKRVHQRMPVKRDVGFHFIQPAFAMIISMLLVLVMYYLFAQFAPALGLNRQALFGAVLGISLMFMGLIVIFSRLQALTDILGYLTMENGVLLFSLFFPELPFVLEILTVMDLVMLIVVATFLAFGIDTTLENFHAKLHQLSNLFGEE